VNTIIRLGMHPFADTFVAEHQYHLAEPVYPLECTLNEATGEIRLKHRTSDDDRYNMYSYSYTSSNSKVSRKHWVDYCDKINQIIPRESKILEIGSNDGFLTNEFIKRGHTACGVDPSWDMSLLAKKRGVHTYHMLFNRENAPAIKNHYGVVDVVVANNVFNHANEPHGFMESVCSVVKDGGYFIFELPYWLYTIKDKKFDQIYHEHVTYFTVKYAYNLLKQSGFQICNVNVVDYHGGSLRIISRKINSMEMCQEAKKMIQQEEEYGLFQADTYRKFMNEIEGDRNKFMMKLYEIKNKGIPIIGVGAAAKANTFLNFYNIDHTIMDFITDASDSKQGKYTPLTRIPIVGDEIFAEYDEVYALILSWNISDLLKSKIKQINNKVTFLSPEELS
jgi:SAM-dependent methyltransferase